MSPEQIIKEVASAIQQGADPNQIAQQLMQQVKDPNVVKQIMEAAMAMVQQQGQGEEGEDMQGMNTQREAQQLLEASIGELGPEVLLAILTAFMQLDDANKQALLQQLQQMASQQGPTQTGQPTEQTEGMNSQDQQAAAMQENLFGK